MLTKIIINGNSQTIQIPKELQFQRLDIDYEMIREKDALVIGPARRKLTDVLNRFAAFSPDFMTEGRPNQNEQKREAL